MTHPVNQRAGGLGQDQTLTHDIIALETSYASSTFVYIQCNLIMLASASNSHRINFWHSKSISG